jgi:metal-dependent amidase/aminoacylase/carboxypeptidase family protein
MTRTEKDQVREAIYERSDQFIQLAHEIHENPELAFFEEYAATRITKFLEKEGFSVRRGICGMPTAFIATTGHGPLHIAFCAEYDALPPACIGAVSSASTSSAENKLDLAEVWLNHDGQEHQTTPLWHACGHNLIAGAAVAAAVGLRDIADQVGLTVSVFGTPGEELVGLPEPRDGFQAAGKIALFEGGAFAGVHAVLMIHPGPSPWSVFIPTHVYLRQRAQFSKTSATRESLGGNELRHLKEALQQTITSLNLVPALYAARPEGQQAGAQIDILWVGSSESETLRAREAVRRCFEEAAASAGVTVQISEYAPGADMYNDLMLSAAFRRNSEVLGRVRGKDKDIQREIREIFRSPQIPIAGRILARLSTRLVSPSSLFMDKVPAEIVYGTDLANVSHVIPAIHPSFGIGGLAGNHTIEFAAQADSNEAYKAMVDGAVALAWTALDAATNPALKAHLLDSASTHTRSSPRKDQSYIS